MAKTTLTIVSAIILPAAVSTAQCYTCPPGSIIEGEPQCTAPDLVNGGCNYTPEVYGPYTVGSIVCGTAWYDGTTRDTDWFRFTLATSTTVSMTGLAEFGYQVGFIQAPCPNTTLHIQAVGDACTPISLNATLAAGTWSMYIAPRFQPSPVPCGSRYTISLNTGATGACCLPTGVCQLLSQPGCLAAGGVYRGANTPCGNCLMPANTWAEQGEASDRFTLAQVTMGSGALNTISGSIDGSVDADLYAIRICSPAAFSAETVTGPGTLEDSQLFLFHSTGAGIVFNDDSTAGVLRSRLTSAFTSTLPQGVYYLGVSPYDVDSVNPNVQELWLDQPYTAERAPDGPGAATAGTGWNGSGIAGTYTIRLTGACFASPAGWMEEADAGDLVGTAQSPRGTGPLAAISGSFGPSSDTDMYAIRLCNPASFSAETATGPTMLGDTQLFLFRPNGLGIVMNDDDPQGGSNLSRLTSAFTSSLPVGNYYLAVSEFDRDPISAAATELWFDSPYTTERAPDGPGAASPVAAWNSTTFTSATYVLRLNGACYPVTACYANCDGSTATPLLTANDFQCFINAFAAGQSYANCDGSTAAPQLTPNDFQCFLNAFAAGCN